jgi:hypothetical protein
MKKIILVLAGTCIYIIILSFVHAPDADKTAALHHTANEYMWDQFHLGNYDSIPIVLEKLEKAYVRDPKNIRTTSHLGFIHLWAFCERGRTDPDSAIFDHVFESNYYFKEAISLNPGDPRLRGFQAAAEICEGAIEKKWKHIAKGYLSGRKAVRRWPVFNKFALSIIESQRDTSSMMFRQGLRYQWEVIDDCSCRKLDREMIMSDPEKVFRELIQELQETEDPLIRRACWNTWIAPHNLEGFFLNFGDMLAKNGELHEAVTMYKAATLSPTYKDWVYKSVIDERIRNVELNSYLFNRRLKLIYLKNEKQIFVNSKIACMGCHQMSASEYTAFGHQEPGDDIYFLR